MPVSEILELELNFNKKIPKTHPEIRKKMRDERFAFFIKYGLLRRFEGNYDIIYVEIPQIPKKLVVYRSSQLKQDLSIFEAGDLTEIGEKGVNLSGGQKARVSIARAMLKDAPIIILDEATAYTDPENEAILQMSLGKLTRGKTLIVIAHRLSTIVDADKIFVVKDGNLVAQGKHEELLRNSSMYAKMWEAHIAGKDEIVKGGEEK